MSISALMQQMADAGAPMEAIIIAVRAIESRDAVLEQQRTAARDKKRRQRAAALETLNGDSPGTVPGQSRDVEGTDGDEAPSPDKAPQTPKINPTPHTGGAPTHTCEGAIPGHRLPGLIWLTVAAYTGSLTASRDTALQALWHGTPPPRNVTDEVWAGFIAHRKAHPKAGKFTDRAYALLCQKLDALAADGWPPGDMLDRAIEHGWITVYPPKDSRHDHHRTRHTAPGQHGNPLVDAAIAREASRARERDPVH